MLACASIERLKVEISTLKVELDAFHLEYSRVKATRKDLNQPLQVTNETRTRPNRELANQRGMGYPTTLKVKTRTVVVDPIGTAEAGRSRSTMRRLGRMPSQPTTSTRITSGIRSLTSTISSPSSSGTKSAMTAARP